MKKTLLSIVLFVLVLFFGFVVVGTTLDAKMGANGQECTEHVDENDDKLCDTCGANMTCEHRFVEAEAEEPTCAKAGHTAGLKCELCGDWREGIGEVIEKLPHTEGDFVARVKSTCTTHGTSAGHICSVCGETYGVEELPLEPHDFATGEYTEGKDSTCTEEGYEGYYTCPDCHAIGIKTTDAEGNEVYEVIEAPVVIPCHHFVENTAVDGVRAGVLKCRDCDETRVVAPFEVTAPAEATLYDGYSETPTLNVNKDVTLTFDGAVEEFGITKCVYTLSGFAKLDDTTKNFYGEDAPDNGAVILIKFADATIGTKGYTFTTATQQNNLGDILDTEDSLYVFVKDTMTMAVWSISYDGPEEGDGVTAIIVIQLAAQDEEVAGGVVGDTDVVAPDAVENGEDTEVTVRGDITFRDWLFGLVGLSVATNPWLTKVVTYGSLALLVVFAIVLGVVLNGKKSDKAPTDTAPKKAKMTKAQRKELREEKKRQKAAKSQKVNTTATSDGKTETRVGRTTHMKF